MKDTGKGLKEVLSEYFEGHSQRLTMMTKLVLAFLQMSTVDLEKVNRPSGSKK